MTGLGLGGSGLGSAASAQLSLECRSPIVDIRIEPASVYYAIFGSLTPVSLIDVDRIGSLCTIDYSALYEYVVIVHHDDHGNLVVQNQ